MMISPLTGAYRPNSPAAIAQKARDFETMAISQFLKPMFDTISDLDPLFGGSPADKSWQPFLMDALAKQMEADGGLGITSQVEATLKEKPAP